MRLLAASCLLLASAGAWAEPAPDSEEQLVLDFKAMQAETYDRPSHVEPALPGSFGELAEPAFRALAVLREASPFKLGSDASKALSEIAGGKRPLESLDPAWQPTLDAAQPHVAAILRATHARNGRPLPDFAIDNMLYPRPDPISWNTLSFFSVLATIEFRQAEKRGEVGSLLERCADAVALTRDLGLVGSQLATWALPVCIGTAERATGPELAKLSKALDRLEQGWLPDAKEVAWGRATEQVMFFYDALSDETKAQIPPPRLQPSMGMAPPKAVTGIRGALLGGVTRRLQADYWTRMGRALALPPRQADAMMKDAGEWASGFYTVYSDGAEWVPASGISFNGVSMLRLFRRKKLALHRFRAVIALCSYRAANHRWPTTWAEAGVAEPVDDRSGLPLKLRVTDGAAWILPQPDPPRTDEDLTLVLR